MAMGMERTSISRDNMNAGTVGLVGRYKSGTKEKN